MRPRLDRLAPPAKFLPLAVFVISLSAAFECLETGYKAKARMERGSAGLSDLTGVLQACICLQPTVTSLAKRWVVRAVKMASTICCPVCLDHVGWQARWAPGALLCFCKGMMRQKPRSRMWLRSCQPT